MSKDNGFDLVTILPNFILGPALSRQDTKGLSVGFMKVSHAHDADLVLPHHITSLLLKTINRGDRLSISSTVALCHSLQSDRV